MSLHIVAGRPLSKFREVLLERAIHLSNKGKRVLFVSMDSFLNEELKKPKPRSFFLESQAYITTDILEKAILTNEPEVLFVDVYDMLLLNDGSQLRTISTYQKMYDYLMEFSVKYDITIHFGKMLGRSIEKREDKQPLLSDLYDFEKNSDTIIGVHQQDGNVFQIDLKEFDLVKRLL